MSDKEKELWAAVVSLSIEDLFAPSPGWRQGINDWYRNRRDAKLFLTKKNGKWAQSRECVCAVLDMDPDALRDRVLQRMEDEAYEDDPTTDNPDSSNSDTSSGGV